MRRVLVISMLLGLFLIPGSVNGCPRSSPPKVPLGPIPGLPICSIQSHMNCNYSYCTDRDWKLYHATVDSIPISGSKVLCDGETDGGGWVIFQLRGTNHENFSRSWNDYKNGFGDLDDEFWWGNENLHLFTRQRTCELHIIMLTEVERHDNRYTKFWIDSEGPGYTLHYDARIEETEQRKPDGLEICKENTFSTYDNGWDKDCAMEEGGGWWYRDHYTCTDAGLNSNKMYLIRTPVLYSQMMVRCFPDHGPIPGLPICGTHFKYDCKSSCIDPDKKLFRGTIEDWMPFARSEVLCDGKTDGGGWVVIQRRWANYTVDFNRGWTQYKNGFGRIDGEFWWGNENLHRFTRGRTCDLHIIMLSKNYERFEERYTKFWIDSESPGYTIHYDTRIEEEGLKKEDALKLSNGQTFSTKDKGWDMKHCAKREEGGWWYWDRGHCADGMLNGDELYWGDSEVQYSQMMVRCVPDHGTIPGLPICSKQSKVHCDSSCIDVGRNLFRGSVDKMPVSRSEVLCDGKTDGGGWVVFQRRWDHTVSFNRGWTQYTNGFGKIEGQFWWGNENLHRFTRQRTCELYIIMMDYEDRAINERFSKFWIDSQANGYRIHYGKRNTNMGVHVGDPLGMSNGESFSTIDNGWDWQTCGWEEEGGWWYQDHVWCAHGNLNAKRMVWGYLGETLRRIRYSQMMVRCQ